MNKKRLNLSLHKTIFHKEFLKTEEDISFIEYMSDALLIEPQIENNEELILYDLDEKEEVTRFKTIDKVLFDEYVFESLICIGVSPLSLLSIQIPSSAVSLGVYGGGDYLKDIMSKDKITFDIWKELKSHAQNFRSVHTEIDLFEFNKDARKICSIIQDLKIETHIGELLFKLKETNINRLTISMFPLSINDFKILATCTNLEGLELTFNIHNIEIIKLPPNLKYLTISGHAGKEILQLVFRQFDLEDLDLSHNTIDNLADIDKLPGGIKMLTLSYNPIKYFILKKIPINLEFLDLEYTFINNSLFEGRNSDTINKTLKFLSLSHSNLKVNSWLITRIIDTFPNLLILELFGNEVEGIPEYLIGSIDETNCLEKIKLYINRAERENKYDYDEINSTFKTSSNFNAKLIWQYDKLPVKIIISDIQDYFKKIFSEMTEFRMFKQGIYCNIINNEISILIKSESRDENSIVFDISAADYIILNEYLKKYLPLLKDIVDSCSPKFILPTLILPKECKEFEVIFKKTYNLYYVIKESPIIEIFNETPNLLVKQMTKLVRSKIYQKSKESKIIQHRHYREIKKIAFVIVSGKRIYPYSIDDDFLIFNIKKGDETEAWEEYHRVSVGKSKDKEVYINSLKNKYLGVSCFQEGLLFLGDNSNGTIWIYFNPSYFKKENKDVICIQKEIKINYANLLYFEKDKKGKKDEREKYFKLEIIDHKIIGTYVDWQNEKMPKKPKK